MGSIIGGDDDSSQQEDDLSLQSELRSVKSAKSVRKPVPEEEKKEIKEILDEQDSD